MRTVGTDLKDWLAQESFCLAQCVKLERTDGVTLGFTTWDEDIVYDGVTYSRMSALSPSVMKAHSDVTVDNLEIVGMLSEESILEVDVLANRYDGASFTIFRLNPRDTAMGVVIDQFGVIGEIRMQDGQYVAELLSLTKRLNQHTRRLMGPFGGRYNDLTGGKTYRLTITYYIPSNCATLSGLRFYTQSGSNMSSTLADLTVKGAWTTVTVDFVNVAGNTGFQLRGINGSSSITWAGAAGAPYDMFYIANVTLTEIGAVVAYEGIPSAMMGAAWVQGNPSVTGADMVMSTGAVPNFPTTRRALQVLSANTTLDRTYETVLVDTSGGTKTITMPLASSSYGMRVYLKRVGANAVTIARSGSDTFFDTSSVTSLSLASDGAKVVLEADAANSRWIVVG